MSGRASTTGARPRPRTKAPPPRMTGRDCSGTLALVTGRAHRRRSRVSWDWINRIDLERRIIQISFCSTEGETEVARSIRQTNRSGQSAPHCECETSWENPRRTDGAVPKPKEQVRWWERGL